MVILASERLMSEEPCHFDSIGLRHGEAGHEPPDRAGQSCPPLGFTSYVISGVGEYVVCVRPDSLAEQIGLRPGDVILSLNQRRLTHEGAWHDAIRSAGLRDGRTTLRVQNGRRGSVADRTFRLFLAGQ